MSTNSLLTPCKQGAVHFLGASIVLKQEAVSPYRCDTASIVIKNLQDEITYYPKDHYSVPRPKGHPFCW